MIDFTDAVTQLQKLEKDLTIADIDPSRRETANLLRALLSELEMGFNGEFFSEDYIKEKCLNLIDKTKAMKQENERVSVS